MNIPEPWPTLTPTMTDLQYVVYVCKLSVEAAAHHTGQNPARIREELAKSGPPPGYEHGHGVEF